MARFYVRDFDNALGFRMLETRGPDLPAGPNGAPYLPWAVTPGRRVVYAEHGAHRGFSGTRGLREYSTLVSQSRRKLAESALGMIALERPELTKKAVSAVSHAVKKYLRQRLFTDHDKTLETTRKAVGHYLFTGGGLTFGRVSTEKASTKSGTEVWGAMMSVLESGTVDQQVAVHEVVGRKLLPAFGGPERTRYNALAPTVREAWFDGPERGRRQVATNFAATTAGGVAPQGSPVPSTATARVRGADRFERDPNRTSHPAANRYFADLDELNLTFGASISGTTGTALQAAIGFADLTGEALKQYFFAVVGYLVGGGMHTFHESAIIAGRVGRGMSYSPGRFDGLLPATFTQSLMHDGWRHSYYDVVVLGSRHWRYNAVGSQTSSTLSPDDKTRLRGEVSAILQGQWAMPHLC